MRSAPDSEVLLLKKKIIYQTPNGICAGKICQNDVHLGNISSVNNELTPWSLQLLQPSAQRSAPRTGTIVGGVDLARSWLPPGSTGMRGLRLGESEQAQMPRKRSGLHCSGFFLSFWSGAGTFSKIKWTWNVLTVLPEHSSKEKCQLPCSERMTRYYKQNPLHTKKHSNKFQEWEQTLLWPSKWSQMD